MAHNSPTSQPLVSIHEETIIDKVTEALERSADLLAQKVEDAVGKGIDSIIKKVEDEEEKSIGAGKPRLKFSQLDVRPSDKATPTVPPSTNLECAAPVKGTYSKHSVGLRLPSLGSVHFRHTDTRTSYETGTRSDEYCREYDHQVLVEFKVTFLKIHDIDTLSQQFEAEVYVQAKWEELALVGLDPKELDRLLPGDLWDPHLIALNVAGEFDQERRSFVVRYEEGYEAPVVLHRWRFKGLFRKALELRHFPFDVQDLTLQVSSERSVEEIRMKHDTRQLSSVNTRTFQDSQEWSIYKHVECTHRTTTVEYASSTIHPILVFSCRVRRRVGYFMWNIVFIVFLVMVLSLLSVSVDPTTSDRMASTMTLFLTMVAFKLVVKQSLPTISYLTYLDIYVLGSLMYLVLFAMENSAMNSWGRWMDRDLVDTYDDFFCMFLAALLILFHLIFIIHIQVTALKRHRQMRENDRQYALQARSLIKRQEEMKKPRNFANK